MAYRSPFPSGMAPVQNDHDDSRRQWYDRIRAIQREREEAMRAPLRSGAPDDPEHPINQAIHAEQVSQKAQGQRWADGVDGMRPQGASPAAGWSAAKSAILSQRNWDEQGNDRPLADDAQLTEWRNMDVSAGRMPPVSGADPADAPLPGEETQPPEVAAANQRKARAGKGWDLGAKGLEGMTDLDRVAAMADGIVTQDEINASLDRQNAAADARHAGFERAMGLPGAEPAAAPAPAKPRYQPKTGLAANMAPGDENMQRQWDEWDASNKAFKEKHGITREEFVHKNRPEHIKERQWMRDARMRFRNELANGTITEEDLYAAYQADPVERSRFTTRLLDNQAAQRQMNVDRRNEQMATTQGMMDPRRGAAMFMESLQQAQTPQDQFNVLMTAYQVTGNPAYGQAAMTIMRGHQDQLSLAQWQAGQQRPMGGVAQAAGDRQQIDAMPLGEARLAAAEAQATAQNGGQPLTPEQRATVRKNEAITATRQMIAAGQRPNAQQVAAMRDLSRNYSTFAGEIGLPPRDPRTMALYREVHGVDPPAITWQEGWNAVGNGIAGLFGAGQAPNNGAQAGQ